MTSKELAIYLVDKMYYSRKYDENENYIPLNAWKHAKECALNCVEFSEEYIGGSLDESFDKYLFLQEVKEEIIKL